MVILDVGSKYRFDSDIFTHPFPAGCSVAECQSACCCGGAIIYGVERRRINSLRKQILPLLEPKNRGKNWFVRVSAKDCNRCEPKALSKKYLASLASMAAPGNYCVFFNKKFGCVLQKLAADKGLEKWALKPLGCVLYPLVVDSHHVIKADKDLDDELWCCKKHAHKTTVFRACKAEIEHAAGKAALKKLEKLEKKFLKKPRSSPV